MRVLLITGRRGGHPWVSTVLKKLPYPPDLVILGGAQGVDQQAEEVCQEMGWNHIVIYPFWKRPDGSTDCGAGHARNRDMVKAALIAHPSPLAIGFPHTRREASPGTYGCLDYCAPRMLTVAVRDNGMLYEYKA